MADHPQLYVKGEFVGGSDIMMEMYEAGEPQQLMPIWAWPRRLIIASARSAAPERSGAAWGVSAAPRCPALFDANGARSGRRAASCSSAFGKPGVLGEAGRGDQDAAPLYSRLLFGYCSLCRQRAKPEKCLFIKQSTKVSDWAAERIVKPPDTRPELPCPARVFFLGKSPALRATLIPSWIWMTSSRKLPRPRPPYPPPPW